MRGPLHISPYPYSHLFSTKYRHRPGLRFSLRGSGLSVIYDGCGAKLEPGQAPPISSGAKPEKQQWPRGAPAPPASRQEATEGPGDTDAERKARAHGFSRLMPGSDSFLDVFVRIRKIGKGHAHLARMIAMLAEKGSVPSLVAAVFAALKMSELEQAVRYNAVDSPEPLDTIYRQICGADFAGSGQDSDHSNQRPCVPISTGAGGMPTRIYAAEAEIYSLYTLTPSSRILSLFSSIGDTEYKASRDPGQAGFYMIIAGRVNVLSNLYKASKQPRIAEFLREDMSLPKNREKARKNAFVLLAQQKFLLSAGWFVLGVCYAEAIEVLASSKYLRNPGCAVAMIRCLHMRNLIDSQTESHLYGSLAALLERESASVRPEDGLEFLFFLYLIRTLDPARSVVEEGPSGGLATPSSQGLSEIARAGEELSGLPLPLSPQLPPKGQVSPAPGISQPLGWKADIFARFRKLLTEYIRSPAVETCGQVLRAAFFIPALYGNVEAARNFSISVLLILSMRIRTPQLALVLDQVDMSTSSKFSALDIFVDEIRESYREYELALAARSDEEQGTAIDAHVSVKDVSDAPDQSNPIAALVDTGEMDLREAVSHLLGKVRAKLADVLTSSELEYFDCKSMDLEGDIFRHYESSRMDRSSAESGLSRIRRRLQRLLQRDPESLVARARDFSVAAVADSSPGLRLVSADGEGRVVSASELLAPPYALSPSEAFSRHGMIRAVMDYLLINSFTTKIYNFKSATEELILLGMRAGLDAVAMRSLRPPPASWSFSCYHARILQGIGLREVYVIFLMILGLRRLLENGSGPAGRGTGAEGVLLASGGTSSSEGTEGDQEGRPQPGPALATPPARSSSASSAFSAASACSSSSSASAASSATSASSSFSASVAKRPAHLRHPHAEGTRSGPKREVVSVAGRERPAAQSDSESASDRRKVRGKVLSLYSSSGRKLETVSEVLEGIFLEVTCLVGVPGAEELPRAVPGTAMDPSPPALPFRDVQALFEKLRACLFTLPEHLVFDNILSFCQDEEYDRVITRIANFTISIFRRAQGRFAGGLELQAFIRTKYVRSTTHRLRSDALSSYLLQVAKSWAGAADQVGGAGSLAPSGRDDLHHHPQRPSARAPVLGSLEPGFLGDSVASSMAAFDGNSRATSIISSASTSVEGSVTSLSSFEQHSQIPSLAVGQRLQDPRLLGTAKGAGGPRHRRPDGKPQTGQRGTRFPFGSDGVLTAKDMSRHIPTDVLLHWWSTGDAVLLFRLLNSVVIARVSPPRARGDRRFVRPPGARAGPGPLVSTDSAEVATLQMFPGALGCCVDRGYVLVIHQDGELVIYRYNLNNYEVFARSQTKLGLLWGTPSAQLKIKAETRSLAKGRDPLERSNTQSHSDLGRRGSYVSHVSRGVRDARETCSAGDSGRFPLQVRPSPSGNLVLVAGRGMSLFSLENRTLASSLAGQELGWNSDARYWMSSSLWPSSQPPGTPNERYVESCMRGPGATAAGRASLFQRVLAGQTSPDARFQVLRLVASWGNAELRDLFQKDFDEVTDLLFLSDELVCVVCDCRHLLAFPLMGAILGHNAAVLAGVRGRENQRGLEAPMCPVTSGAEIPFRVRGFRSYWSDKRNHIALAGRDGYAVYGLDTRGTFALVRELGGAYSPLGEGEIRVFRPSGRFSRCCGSQILLISDGVASRSICTECGALTENAKKGFVALHRDCLYCWE